MSSSQHPLSSHVSRLDDSLRLLQQQQDAPASAPGDQEADVISPANPVSWDPRTKDGYGFRKSGVSTPLAQNQQPLDLNLSSVAAAELVPDPNGLGWPGK